MLSHFSHVLLFAILRTVAHQTPLSVGFPRQGYWSGLPCPPPGDLPNPGIKPMSLAFPTLAGGFFTTPAIDHIQRDSFGDQISRKGTNAAADFHSPIPYLDDGWCQGYWHPVCSLMPTVDVSSKLLVETITAATNANVWYSQSPSCVRQFTLVFTLFIIISLTQNYLLWTALIHV